jgi:glycosyltransferase involved in cell wall biosynthesis
MTVSLDAPVCLEQTEDDPAALPRAGSSETYAIEFAGWLPCFKIFGDCGRHPQFSHTDAPPAGYRFVRSEPKSSPGARAAREWRLGVLTRKILRAAWLTVRPLCSVVRHAQSAGPGRSLRTLAAVVRLYLVLRRAGCSFWPTVQFLRTRHFPSQVLVPPQAKLLFLTSVPYTFSQRPWVIEIEDATTLFYPHHMNGCTSRTAIQHSPYLPVVKALLESDACRGIVTHMRSTAEALPKLFRSEVVAAKITYIPYGITLPPIGQDQTVSKHLDILFTCSWRQGSDSFFLRGGLDVLRAFEIVHERYPHVRLTLRTGLPPLKPPFRRVVEKCWVRVIDRFLSEDEMDALMRGTHVFLLPSARLAVVSVLRAMAYGQVVVASDGWGFREYIDHGRNGMIVQGRYGNTSWMEDETGMLREDHAPMFTSHSGVVRGLVEAMSSLVEDHELRRRLGAQARQDVVGRFSLQNWNRGLKQALDQATRRAE